MPWVELTYHSPIVKFDVMIVKVKSRKLRQLPISAKMGTFLEKKGTKNFTTPYPPHVERIKGLD